MPDKKQNKYFIAGSRDISFNRILEIFKKYSVKGDIIWGVYEEDYIKGFEDQPQFMTLKAEKIEKFINKISELKITKLKNNFKNDFKLLKYQQINELEILNKIDFNEVIFVNGSWKIAFHRREQYKILENKNIKPKLISPFVDEAEALNYFEKVKPKIQEKIHHELSKAKEMNLHDFELLELADKVSKQSFDYTWQTGAVLTRDGKVILTGYNKVLPFETFSMLYGSKKEHGIDKETNLSELHNLNNNDTLHAEMDILTQALNLGINLKGTTLHINLLPCPNCAQIISATEIIEIVYKEDHSGGYAVELFEKVGIKIRKAKCEIAKLDSTI